MADPLFEVDETVLVQDRGKLYESKILKTKMCNKTWQYFVHYQGWNRKYDCWADEKLIKKKTTEGKISRISGLTVEDSATKKKVKTRLYIILLCSPFHETQKVNDEDEIAKKKRKKTMMQSDLVIIRNVVFLTYRSFWVQLDDDDGNLMTSMKYQVPLTLKKHLVDEWEMIAKAPHRLLKLPRTYTVQTILHEFLAEKGLRGDDSQQTRYRDLFEMLRIYFDKVRHIHHVFCTIISLYLYILPIGAAFDLAVPSRKGSGAPIHSAPHTFN